MEELLKERLKNAKEELQNAEEKVKECYKFLED